MNALSIIEYDGKAVMDSREVAEWVEKNHKDLMRDIRGYEEILTGASLRSLDFFIPSTYKDAKGEERPNYLITRKGCEMVANKMTGQKGVLFTAAYIEKFHEYEDKIKLAIPQDYPSALRALAETFEEKQQLEAKVQADAPKVLFASAVEASHTSILVGDLAKLIRQNGVEIGQKRLFQWMRDNGYLMKAGASYNLPTQYSMERGWMEIKESSISNPDGSVRVTKTTKITGKGQTYFVNALLVASQLQA